MTLKPKLVVDVLLEPMVQVKQRYWTLFAGVATTKVMGSSTDDNRAKLRLHIELQQVQFLPTCGSAGACLKCTNLGGKTT